MFFEEGDWIDKDTIKKVFNLKGYARGINTSKAQNIIVCISAENGPGNPYIDKWYHNDEYDGILYTGEGQQGDQKLTRENKNLADKRKAHFFRKVKQRYLYCGEFLLKKCIQKTENGIDGLPRIVFKFNMKYSGNHYPEKLRKEMNEL